MSGHHTLRTASLSLLLALVATADVVRAQGPAPDLSRLSIEELMRLEVTSASRKEQPVADVPGAVHVLTAEDIRRSGMTTLPDLLRLVPGVHVAQINSNKSAVSIRGFNGLYATKLLVLIDGRAIYNRLYAGVLWDTDDIVLDEIERIEILRGPGGPMWGTNAVNGVINVVMKPADARHGTVVRAGAGTLDRAGAAVAHSGVAGPIHYRVFSRWRARGESRLGSGGAGDDAESWRSGGRVEHKGARTDVMFDIQAAMRAEESMWLTPSLDPSQSVRIGGRSDAKSGAMIARLTHRPTGASVLQVQTSLEATSRDERISSYRHRAGDIDAQYRFSARRHDVVIGAAHRVIDESLPGSAYITLSPSRARESISSVFAQDDIDIGRHVTASLSARLEKDTGFDPQVQPTARAIWRIAPRQRLWGAVSRAVRMPSLEERGILVLLEPIDVGGPLRVATTHRGDPGMKPEALISSELGYRGTFGPVEIDMAGYISRYSGLSANDRGAPDLQSDQFGPYLLVPAVKRNLLDADTRGVEAWLRGRIAPELRVEAGVTFFSLSARPYPSGAQETLRQYDAATPRQQVFARAAWTRGATDVDLFVSRVGRVVSEAVAPYTRLDLRVERHFASQVSLALVGQNLLDASHAESRPSDILMQATDIPRSVLLHLRWRIR